MRSRILHLGIVAIVLSMALTSIGAVGVTTSPSKQSAPSSPASPAAVIALRGMIDNYSRDSFIRRVNQARTRGAKAIVIDLETDGGLVSAGLDLSRFIKGLDGVETIAFV